MSWVAPVVTGGCPIEGYRIYAQDIYEPGYFLVYNGITLSGVTRFSAAAPNIKPSKFYQFMI
jgi:hypothetical protein